jgi:hypothetical protein
MSLSLGGKKAENVADYFFPLKYIIKIKLTIVSLKLSINLNNLTMAVINVKLQEMIKKVETKMKKEVQQRIEN